ncbi:hypothetical protein K458DRAFT_34077 [Lentithecium fluviatile CBS 122367]|uniref:Uncharacterized protein n=1 Tax=Lentithecium fluviatile CBS 122367 TaxID=1168545 RepID=A0A6G1J262_9PLEO|nr:hypothetical protein K458DRAFT_34077 [Lentithecium fluviatile CBS 122367]
MKETVRSVPCTCSVSDGGICDLGLRVHNSGGWRISMRHIGGELRRINQQRGRSNSSERVRSTEEFVSSDVCCAPFIFLLPDTSLALLRVDIGGNAGLTRPGRLQVFSSGRCATETEGSQLPAHGVACRIGFGRLPGTAPVPIHPHPNAIG